MIVSECMSGVVREERRGDERGREGEGKGGDKGERRTLNPSPRSKYSCSCRIQEDVAFGFAGSREVLLR